MNFTMFQGFQIICIVVEKVLYLIADCYFACVLNSEFFQFLLEKLLLGVDGGPLLVKIVDFPKVLEVEL